MTARPPFTVAVCTRGRPHALPACLLSVAAQREDGDELLVVHNDERDDGTAAAAEAAGARLVREPRPGLDRARNRALAEARNELVAFLDDDARAEPGWLAALARGFDREEVSCVTGRVLAAELRTDAQRLFEACKSFDRGTEVRRFHRNYRAPFFPVRAGIMGTGCNMACRREVGRRLGFDPALDVGTPARGCGDLDFYYRVIRAGGEVVYRPDAVVRHVHRDSIEALRRLRYDYGVGSAAFAWKCMTEHRDPKAPLFLAWKILFHVAEIAAGTLRLRRWPPGLAWQELRGMFAGPRALARARREERGA